MFASYQASANSEEPKSKEPKSMANPETEGTNERLCSNDRTLTVVGHLGGIVVILLAAVRLHTALDRQVLTRRIA
jgi:hypothetical protein